MHNISDTVSVAFVHYLIKITNDIVILSYIVYNFVEKRDYVYCTNIFWNFVQYVLEDIMANEKIWLSSPTMHGEELKYVTEAYETNWMSTIGENINEVERQICDQVGCKYAIALSAGTAALHLAVKLAGVKHGDRVFCCDMTL